MDRQLLSVMYNRALADYAEAKCNVDDVVATRLDLVKTYSMSAGYNAAYADMYGRQLDKTADELERDKEIACAKQRAVLDARRVKDLGKK